MGISNFRLHHTQMTSLLKVTYTSTVMDSSNNCRELDSFGPSADVQCRNKELPPPPRFPHQQLQLGLIVAVTVSKRRGPGPYSSQKNRGTGFGASSHRSALCSAAPSIPENIWLETMKMVLGRVSSPLWAVVEEVKTGE